MRSTWFTALPAIVVLVGCANPEEDKPLREDDRAYSTSVDDRAYVAARCAALYSATAQTLVVQDTDLAETKQSEAAAFLGRVAHTPQDVFFHWSTEYRERLHRQEDPATTLLGKDYDACSAILILIRNGDKLEERTPAELKFIIGG